jgi:Caspase domain
MKRALVLASQTQGLRGADADARLVAEMLRRRKFDAVDVRTGNDATRAGILAGYDKLIADSKDSDVAVVYYSGHGAYALATNGPVQSWQCIVPTDHSDSTENDWRGITNWELSIKQAQLTKKTKNVTVILDCCHSSQMSRDAAVREAVPRSLPHPLKVSVAAHLEHLRSRYPQASAEVDPIGNQDAVRLVACGQTESAYEYPDDRGDFRGAFTETLLAVLDEAGDAELSWRSIADAVRARVLAKFAMQRPDVEGPARRKIFSLVEETNAGVITLSSAGGVLKLPVGRLTGVVLGDTFGVMRVGAQAYKREQALGTVEVTDVGATTSTVRAEGQAPAFPPDAVAIPLTKNATLRAVRVEVPAAERAAIEGALALPRTLRVAGPDDADTLATLKLANGRLTIEDPLGPLFPPARYPSELAPTAKNVANLGVARAIRELEGQHGVYDHELSLELGVVENGKERKLPDHGAALGLGDRVYVKVRNVAQRRLYVHVFNIGVRGKVTLLTNDAPSGVALDSGTPEFVLGRGADGTLKGTTLSWPEGLPRGTFPRLDEVVVIVTTSPASLRSLETQEFITREGGEAKAAKGLLEGLLAQVQQGGTRDVGTEGPGDKFNLTRLSFMLHPREARMGGLAFEIDENPTGQAAACDPDAWLTPGVDASAKAPALAVADAPNAIAIQLADLVVEKNRALLSADVRVDALVCTRSAAGGRAYATWTQKYSGIKDGQRLPLEKGLLYLGPVRDFVDLTLFVSRDTTGSLELAKLFEQRMSSPDFKDAASALLVAAGAAAAPWAAAVGASAVLTRIAYELVLGVTNKTIGLYRTSFLRRELFGVGRHPAESLYRAQDFSFSVSIERVEL